MSRKVTISTASLIQLLVILVCVFISSVILGPLQEGARKRAEVLRTRIISNLEDSLGIQIRYDSISPALLSAVSIRNLSVEFDGGSFNARRLQVFYNPIRMLSGDRNDPVRLISRVVVDDGNVDLVVNPSNPDPDVSGDGTGSDESFDILPLLVNKTVQLRNFSANVSLGDLTTFAASNLDFTLSNQGDTLRYSLVASVDASSTHLPTDLGVIHTQLATKGSFSTLETSVHGRLDLKAAESDLVVLSPVSIDYTYGLSGVTARRIDDERPFDMEFLFNSEDSTWNTHFVAVDLSLRDLLSPGASRRNLDPWFSTVLDGEGSLSGSAQEGLESYDMDFQTFIPNGALPWAMQARVKARGNGNRIRIPVFEASTEFGTLAYSGAIDLPELEPDGRLDFKLDDSALDYPIQASFNLSSLNGVISAEPVDFEAAGLEFDDFRFLVIREEDRVTVSLLAVPGIRDDDTERLVLMDAMLDMSGKPVFHGFATVKGLPASYLARLAGADVSLSGSLLDNALVDVKGFFESSEESWMLSIDEALLVQQDKPENRLTLRARIAPGSWSMDGLRLSWNGFVADGRGFAEGTRQAGTAQGRFLIDESLYPVEAQWFADGSLEFSGEYGLDGFLGPSSPRGRSFRLVSDDMSFPLQSGTLDTRVDIRGRLAGNDWEMYVNTLNLDFKGNEDIGNLQLDLNGTVSPSLIVLPNIRFADSFGTVVGNARLEDFAGGRSMRGALFLNGDENESYKALFVREDNQWDVNLDLSASPLGRFSRERLQGEFNVNGQFTGTTDNPLISLDAGVENAFLDGTPFDAAAKVSLENGRLMLRNLGFSHNGVKLDRALAILDMNKGTLRSTAELNADYNQVPVSTGFSLAMDFDNPLSLAQLPTLPEMTYTGTLATRPVLWAEKPHLPALTFQFLKDDERFLARTPDGKALNLSFDFFSGQLNLVSGAPLPIVAQGGGRILDDRISLSFPVLEVDPVLINYVMVRDPILLQYHVVFQDGIFAGNLDIEGPLSDPGFYGTIEARDLLVDTPYTYAKIGRASTTVRFNENRITFDQIDVPVGDGFVYGRGYMEIDRWSLTDFNMVYGGRGGPKSPGVPVYYPLLSVYLDGLFNGEITMKGDGKAFWLAGDIRFPFLKASLGEARTPVDQTVPGHYPTPVFLDFNIITGNNCTFFLPNEQFKIVKATAEPGQALKLIYSSIPETFTFTGTLPIKSGDIYYFDRDFQITEGAISFNESLLDFDPVLSFRAETRVRDEDDDEVTVALVYDAPILSDFNPKIETVPVKSELEILALFGQAVNPYANGSDGDPSAVLLATGGFLSQMGIVQPFEEVLREGLNLDMVTIRTDIIANALSEGLSQPDTTTGADIQSSGLGRYLDNTSLFAGKYIGNALFVSGSVTANYFEGERLRSVFGGLEFSTAVSLEMETPFFNVGWSYSPDPVRSRHFIEDNEFTLKWKFTY